MPFTECATYGSQAFTLVFSGTVLGDSVHAHRTESRRAAKINERQNFWSTNVVLDGRYPALVYDHKFLVYNEEDYPLDYLRWFAELNQQIGADPYPVELRIGSDVVVAYGDCYLQEPRQVEPDTLLLHAAGIVELGFVGTSIPSVI